MGFQRRAGSRFGRDGVEGGAVVLIHATLRYTVGEVNGLIYGDSTKAQANTDAWNAIIAAAKPGDHIVLGIGAESLGAVRSILYHNGLKISRIHHVTVEFPPNIFLVNLSTTGAHNLQIGDETDAAPYLNEQFKVTASDIKILGGAVLDGVAGSGDAIHIGVATWIDMQGRYEVVGGGSAAACFATIGTVDSVFDVIKTPGNGDPTALPYALATRGRPLEGWKGRTTPWVNSGTGFAYCEDLVIKNLGIDGYNTGHGVDVRGVAAQLCDNLSVLSGYVQAIDPGLDAVHLQYVSGFKWMGARQEGTPAGTATDISVNLDNCKFCEFRGFGATGRFKATNSQICGMVGGYLNDFDIAATCTQIYFLFVALRSTGAVHAFSDAGVKTMFLGCYLNDTGAPFGGELFLGSKLAGFRGSLTLLAPTGAGAFIQTDVDTSTGDKNWIAGHVADTINYAISIGGVIQFSIGADGTVQPRVSFISDVIGEKTANAGVRIDGLLVKDNALPELVGLASGIASLDANTRVPFAQMPYMPVREVAAAATFVAGTDYAIGIDATGGALAGNLPAATAALAGVVFELYKKDASANAVNLTPNGTDTIDGVNAAVVLSVQWQSVRVMCRGLGGWKVL